MIQLLILSEIGADKPIAIGVLTMTSHRRGRRILSTAIWVALLNIALFAAVPPILPVEDICVIQQLSTIRTSTGEGLDRVGGALATDDDLLVVGLRTDDELGLLSGAAYVYRFVGNEWIFEAKLKAANGQTRDEFGGAVAIHDGVIAVGSIYAGHPPSNYSLGPGAVYVFEKTGNEWSQTAKLTAAFPQPDSVFGVTVAIDEDMIIVGAPEENVYYGAAYAFQRINGAWVQVQRIIPSSYLGGDWFGYRLSLDTSRLIVGAIEHGTSTAATFGGSAYIFDWNGVAWEQSARLTASDASDNDYFGHEVNLNGDIAVIGAYNDASEARQTGAAYVFRWNGSVWNEEAKLTSPDPGDGDSLGISAFIDNDVILVGAHSDNFAGLADAGSAYVFRFDGATWNFVARLQAPDAENGSYFGGYIRHASGRWIISAPGQDDDGTSRGATYTLQLDWSDCNANGRLDLCDRDCDGNGNPDDCDATIQDLDGDGVADSCDNCLATANRKQIDCDGDGIGDVCTIELSPKQDCDFDGYLDICQTRTSWTSLPLNPVGAGWPHEFVVRNPPVAAGDVYLSIAAAADLASQFEYLSVYFNGIRLGDVFVATGGFCAQPPELAEIRLPKGAFNQMTSGGLALVRVVPFYTVNVDQCAFPEYITIALRYENVARDCGGDLFLDSCDASLTDTDHDGVGDDCDNCPNKVNSDQLDCDGDGMGDACSVELDHSLDCNGNDVPDTCELGFFKASPVLTPIGWGFPQAYDFHHPPRIHSDVILDFEVKGDFSHSSETIDVYVNTIKVGTILGRDSHDCPYYPDLTRLVVPGIMFDSAAGGHAQVRLVPSNAVDPFQCTEPSYIRVTISYAGRDGHDCNDNRIPDECDIDADDDSVPDDCDNCPLHLNPLQQDCDSNGEGDACAVAQSQEPDCNTNGVPDHCDVTHLTSGDCNHNTIPDECELDCDGDGVTEDCDNCPEYVNSDQADCDADGTGDLCVLALGLDSDCNGNAIPDFCDIHVLRQSPRLAPIGEDTVQSVTFSGLPRASSDVLLHVTAFGNFGASGESIYLDLNGVELGEVLTTLGSNCPALPDVDAWTIPAWKFNAAAPIGVATITLRPSSVVDTLSCFPDESWASVTMTYVSEDCGENGIPDICETKSDVDSDGVIDICDNCPIQFNSNQRDCDNDGVGDVCAIESGQSNDCNGNGTPDLCEIAAGAQSPDLSPIGYLINQHWLFPTPPPASGNVTLRFWARADLRVNIANLRVEANTEFVGTVFEFGAHDCPATPDAAQLVLSGAVFNNLVSGGELHIEMLPTYFVEPDACILQPTFAAVQLSYSELTKDRNENDIPDGCDVDFDADGDVDLVDAAKMYHCFSEMAVLSDPKCVATDFNADGLLSLVNSTVLAEEMSGPR